MVDGVIGLVASGYDDGSGHAMRQRSVDDRLRVLAARTHVRIAEAHVDDMGGMRICGGPGDTQSGGPGDAVENVGEKPATLPQDPNRQNHRPPVDACSPGPVVAIGGDQAAHQRAMPAAVRHRASFTP